jgi:hypothetical protein
MWDFLVMNLYGARRPGAIELPKETEEPYMGDRANVAILDYRGQAVVLYTHWNGVELPVTVKAALRTKDRWGDSSYLARIIFDEMTDGQKGGATGFGILANRLDDNEYPILVIDTRSQRITVRPEPDEGIGYERLFSPIDDSEGMTLSEFIALTDAEADAFRS